MKEIYFVEETDTIESIAQRYKLRASDILGYNKITPENIQPGVALIISRQSGVRYVVKPFDSLAKIAKAHDITVELLSKHNDVKDVFLGQIIFIPDKE